ncbi:MAG: hypothetical protein KJ822_09840 [Proteobacteria bacterium]|nr:hypothetical protein [Pseudomonadota bacterium]MBU4355634.1 hypothetical protein [Pseudomonadota bacterium]
MDTERCACCKKHKSELKPFGRGGYRFFGDFNGELLCETSRPVYPPDDLEDKVYAQFFGQCQTDAEYEKAREAMVQAYGEEIAEEITHFALGKSATVWLCRHCIALDWDEFHAKRRQACSSNQAGGSYRISGEMGQV